MNIFYPKPLDVHSKALNAYPKALNVHPKALNGELCYVCELFFLTKKAKN